MAIAPIPEPIRLCSGMETAPGDPVHLPLKWVGRNRRKNSKPILRIFAMLATVEFYIFDPKMTVRENGHCDHARANSPLLCVGTCPWGPSPPTPEVVWSKSEKNIGAHFENSCNASYGGIFHFRPQNDSLGKWPLRPCKSQFALALCGNLPLGTQSTHP